AVLITLLEILICKIFEARRVTLSEVIPHPAPNICRHRVPGNSCHKMADCLDTNTQVDAKQPDRLLSQTLPVSSDLHNLGNQLDGTNPTRLFGMYTRMPASIKKEAARSPTIGIAKQKITLAQD